MLLLSDLEAMAIITFWHDRVRKWPKRPGDQCPRCGFVKCAGPVTACHSRASRIATNRGEQGMITMARYEARR